MIVIKKVVIAVDKFKRTLSAKQITELIEKKIKIYFPNCEVIKLPLADGGDGTLECFSSYFDVVIRTAYVHDLNMKNRCVEYGLFNNGHTAIIETAKCAGQVLMAGKLNCIDTTMYGVGELIRIVTNLGCDEIIVALGGTCTNDAATGAALFNGIKFYDKNNKELFPTGKTLSQISKIEKDSLISILENKKMIVLCDSKLPMYGINGSAFMSAAQKGATNEQIIMLDYGLKNISNVINKDLGIDIEPLKRGGTSGGAAGGFEAFFGVKPILGIDYILEKIKFTEQIKDADLVITGEGKIDNLTLLGKTTMGVAKACKRVGIPLLALAGEITLNNEELASNGFTYSFTINRTSNLKSITKKETKNNLNTTLDNILRLIKYYEK